MAYHKAIYGMTGQGKTWLLKRLSKKFRQYHQEVIVWSGVADNDWAKGVIYTIDIDHLEETLKRFILEKKRAFVILDEASIFKDEVNKKKHPICNTLFMKGRHHGFACYAATQYPTSMERKARVNCGECFCFKLGDEESAKLVWEDYGRRLIDGKPAWQEIMKLEKLEYLHFETSGNITKGTL